MNRHSSVLFLFLNFVFLFLFLFCFAGLSLRYWLCTGDSQHCSFVCCIYTCHHPMEVSYRLSVTLRQRISILYCPWPWSQLAASCRKYWYWFSYHTFFLLSLYPASERNSVLPWIKQTALLALRLLTHSLTMKQSRYVVWKLQLMHAIFPICLTGLLYPRQVFLQSTST